MPGEEYNRQLRDLIAKVDGDDFAFSGQRRDYRVPVANTGTEPMDPQEWLTGALPS